MILTIPMITQITYKRSRPIGYNNCKTGVANGMVIPFDPSLTLKLWT